MRNSLLLVFVVVGSLIWGNVATAQANIPLEEPDSAMGEANAKSLLKLSKEYWSTNPSQSLALAQKAYRKTILDKNNAVQADALSLIGSAYYFLEVPDSSMSYFQKSYSLSVEIDYKEGISRAANNLGLILDNFGDYEKAIKYYLQSLTIDLDTKNDIGVAAVYLNMGSIYYYLKEYDIALEYMTNSLHIHTRLNDSTGILKCLNNIGTIYSNLQILDNAHDYISRALTLSRQLNNIDQEAVNLNNLGKVYFEKRNYKEALSLYNQALEIEKSQENQWSEANTLKNIGVVYLAEGNKSQALSYLYEALQIANNIKANQLLSEIYNDLYIFYESKKEFETAFGFLKKYTVLTDSIYNINRRREIATANTRFKLNLKELELTSLRDENEMKSLKIGNQKYLIYFFSSLITVILIALFFLYYRFRSNLKAKKLEESKNAQISEQNILLEKAITGLSESEEKYKGLSNSIQDGLVILQNQKLVFTNDKLCHMLGYQSQQEMHHLKPEDVIAAEDLEKTITNYSKRIAGEDVPTNYPVKLLHKSGKIIETNLCVSATQLHGEPAIIGTFKVLSDIENYKSRLLQEKQKAEQATLAKSLFLAGMSHEIRNHMSSIIGITEVLVDLDLSDEISDYVDVINNSGNKLMVLINDILDLSKIEAGQVDLDLSEFKLSQSLKDIEAMFELIARQQNLYLKVSLEPDIPKILIGDPQRLSQVLINLVGNAFKFTDHGGIHIQIELQEVEETAVKLIFNVIDTGIGISPDSQDKLFKAFSQTHSAVQRKQKGTGLGLVICKNIVKLMNGEIGVESSTKKGSNFWFTARFNLPDKSQDPAELEKDQPMNEKILLVEDNLLNQHLTTTILGKQGYKTDIADNGKIGVEMFRKKFYKIILMDIQMPEMDGIQATRLIRKFESDNYSKQSTIIAVTAHAKEGEKEKLFEAGMNHYLSKPFKPDELLTLLEYVRNG